MFSDEFWKALPNMKGNQLWIAALVIFVIAVLALVRYLLIPGASKAAAQEKKDERDAEKDEQERRDTISVMQGQIRDLQGEVRGLRREVARMRRVEMYDRECRHSLANQVQALVIAVEVGRELIKSIGDEWPEMPRHFQGRIASLKTPEAIISRWPLPPPLEDEEVEAAST